MVVLPVSGGPITYTAGGLLSTVALFGFYTAFLMALAMRPLESPSMMTWNYS